MLENIGRSDEVFRFRFISNVEIVRVRLSMPLVVFVSTAHVVDVDLQSNEEAIDKKFDADFLIFFGSLIES